MRYRFVAAERATFPVRTLCRLVGVAASGFYAWLRRRPGRRRRGRPTGGRKDRGDLRRQPAHLRQPARARRAAGGGRPDRPQAGGAADARDGPRRPPAAAAVAAHDRQPARPPGRAEPARPELRGRAAGHGLAGRHLATSRPARAGCTWPPSRTWPRARSSAGAWPTTSGPSWRATPCGWPSAAAAAAGADPPLRPRRCRADSSGRRNTSTEEVAMARRRRRSDRSGRGELRSPGRPGVARREDRRRFWAAIAAGLSSEDAAMEVGVSPAGRGPLVPGGGRHATIDISRGRRSRPRGGTCRSRSGRRSRSCGRRATGCGRSPAGSGGRRRRSRASCGATPRRAAAAWSIGPPRPSGTPSGRRGVRSRRSWRRTRRCGRTCRTGWPAPSSPRTGRRSPGRRCPGRAAATGGGSIGAGRGRGARSRSPARLRLDFPDDETMRISHEAIYQALYVQGRGALRRELTACLRTGRALRVPRARSRGRGKSLRHPRGPDQRAPGGGGRPGGAGALGGRPHPRAGQLGDRHAGGAHDAVHDAAAPAAAWRATGAGPA